VQAAAAPACARRSRVPAPPRLPLPHRGTSFGISVGTAHAYIPAVTGLLADRAPGLLKTLREHDPDFVLLDGTFVECDRVGDSRADYSAKQRRHGVNVQVVTDSAGEVLWISPALPGRTHDLTVARTHKIVRICERQGPDPRRSRLHGRQPLGHHQPQTTARRGAHSHSAHRQPRPRPDPGPCRARHGTAEVLADLPQIPDQPQPHDRHRQSRPHPGEATLKTLTGVLASA
jgi:hypothetical protein